MKKKLKIAVICENPHYILGGIENYNSVCYENWESKYHVTEFPIIKDIGKRQVVRNRNPNIKINYSLVGWNPNLMIWGGIYTKKKMQKIYQNFDVVIINTFWTPKKWLSHPKTLLVQHGNLKEKFWWWNWNDVFFSIGLLINSLLFNVTSLKQPFKKVNNAVYYGKETSDNLLVKNIWYILLGHKSQKDLLVQKSEERSGFVWMGRLNKQKNIKAAVQIANLNSDFNIYGDGDKRLLKELKNQTQYKGLILKKDVDNVLRVSRGFILTSTFTEGFAYVVVEALSMGNPVIMFNTFKSAQILAKCQAVFLIEKDDIQAMNHKMNWLRNLPNDEYQIISNQAIEFAKNHLTKEVFWNNWDQVFHYFQQQKNELSNKKVI